MAVFPALAQVPHISHNDSMKLCTSYGTAVKTYNAKVTARSSPLPGMLHRHDIYIWWLQVRSAFIMYSHSHDSMRHLSAERRTEKAYHARFPGAFSPLSSGEPCCQRGPLHVRAVFRRCDALGIHTRDHRLAVEAHKDFHATLTPLASVKPKCLSSRGDRYCYRRRGQMNRTWNRKEGTAIGEMNFIRTVSTHRIYSVYIYVGFLLACGRRQRS